MNQASQLALHDLGDAKLETKGDPKGPRLEDDQVSQYRPIV